MSKAKNQSFCTTEENLQEKAWKNDELKSHQLLEEPIGSVLAAKVQVFSDSVFCADLSALV